MYKLNSIKRLFILLAIMTSSITIVVAQDTDNIYIHPDMNLVKYSNAWLRSDNAAGMFTLPVNNISLAEVYLDKSNGKYVNYFESDNSYQYGAKAESFYKIGEKVVVYGNIGYSKFSGKNMSGSILINPDFNSFNITEVNDSTAGKKDSELYHLIGAISVEAHSGLRLGGKVDYRAQNYAKFKDLRHRNELTDLALTVGASYNIGNRVNIGANYYYRRSIEELYFKQYGNNEVYKLSMFISYGNFYGRRESYNASGTSIELINNNIKPMVNLFHGGNIQLDWNISNSLNFFNEFTYKSRTGYLGLKSLGEVAYTEHEGDILGYRGEFSLKNNNNSHVFVMNLGQEKMKNYEKNYTEEKEVVGGATFIKYAGRNLVSNKTEYAVGLEYFSFLGIKEFVPLWTLKANADFYERKGRTSLYPYYRKQNLHYINIGVGGERNFINGKNIYTISLGVNYHFGDGTAKKDGGYVSPTEEQTAPETMDQYLNAEFEYLTASNISADTSFKYSRMINHNVWGYAVISGNVKNGFDIEYAQGKTYVSTQIKIGCSF